MDFLCVVYSGNEPEAHRAAGRAQNGAGLGLALCKRIAELHGTRLEFTSAPGEGTTVRVFLEEAANEA